VLQCVAVCCSVLRPPLFAMVFVAACCSVFACLLQRVCCSVLQCVCVFVAACCSVFACVLQRQEVHTNPCSVLQCVCVFVAACCSVFACLLQRVAVCLRVCCSIKRCTRTPMCTRALQRVHRLHKSVLKCIAVCCSAFGSVSTTLVLCRVESHERVSWVSLFVFVAESSVCVAVCCSVL